MRKIHFVGIGGIGMSALADIYLAKGHKISGSDLRPNNLTGELQKKGAVIYEGHAYKNVPPDADIVISTNCIRDDNPEIIAAKTHGIRIIPRGELLKELFDEAPFSVGVTGAHGKTTTSSLIAHIFEFCGKNPTIAIGGEVLSLKSNAKLGGGKIFVAEIDESDGYFQNISTSCAVITNVEKEHMDHYGSMENLVKAVEKFVGNIPDGGAFIYSGEDAILTDIANKTERKKISYGFGEGFDVTCRDADFDGSISFKYASGGKVLGEVKSALFGRHNLMNMMAAVSAAILGGLEFKEITGAILAFKGVKRRFELVKDVNGIEIVEDYAHHPTEIRAVLKAASKRHKGRVIAVFQPHRFTRTRDLAGEFAECFYDADMLFLTDVYSADEDTLEGAGTESIYNLIDKESFEETDLLRKDAVPPRLARVARRGDTILLMGAGDIREIAPQVVKALEEN